MSKYSLTHVSDAALTHDLAAAATHDRASTAILLAHIAEFDARKLYVPAAYPSMYLYCVHELRLGEQAAFKRIRAARAAQQFPAIFTAIAEGRLNLSTVVLLAPHLCQENAEELLSAAAGQSQDAIERLLAQRFPRPDVPTLVSPLGTDDQLSSGAVGAPGSGDLQLSSRTVEAPAPRPAEDSAPQKLAPLSPQRYALQTTVDQETYDLLRHAQALLGHQLSSGDIAPVLTRALKLLVRHLERRKFGAAKSPRRGARRPSANPRHIPAAVKRAVRERDQDQCTFRSESGQRCPARTRLEFDHIEPVARGGQATVDGMRLRCRAHNQYAAECTFGAGFVARKQEQARESAAAKRKQAAEEVIPYLRALGFRADESRAAAALCEATPDASLEQRAKLALTYFAGRHCTRWRPATAAASPA